MEKNFKLLIAICSSFSIILLLIVTYEFYLVLNYVSDLKHEIADLTEKLENAQHKLTIAKKPHDLIVLTEETHTFKLIAGVIIFICGITIVVYFFGINPGNVGGNSLSSISDQSVGLFDRAADRSTQGIISFKDGQNNIRDILRDLNLKKMQ